MGAFTITGGAGFIGSHLADSLLAAGHRVRVLDDFSTGRPGNLDPRCEVFTGTVCDPDAVRQAMDGVDGCFHLAAIASVARSNEDWLGTHRVNLGGTIAVLDAARTQGGVPVVYASSAAVYGRTDAVADEQMRPAPMTAYGADKLGSELHASAGSLVHGVPTLGFRFFNVYGPRQDPDSPYSGVISIFAKAIAEGRPITVHGDGLQTRDLVYVADIVAHLTRGMDYLLAHRGTLAGAAGVVLNACTGRETTVLAMAEILSGLLGQPARVAHGPARPGDIRRSCGSPDLARRTLGIQAETPVHDGLAALAATLAGHGR